MTLLSRQSVRQFAENRALTLFAAVIVVLVSVTLALLSSQDQNARLAWPFAATGFALGSFVQLLVVQLRGAWDCALQPRPQPRGALSASDERSRPMLFRY